MDPRTRVRFVLGNDMRRRQWRGIDLYRVMDKDKDGSVDSGEFCRALVSLKLPLLGQEEAAALWDEFDADGSGSVDANELKDQFDKLKSQAWSGDKPVRKRTAQEEELAAMASMLTGALLKTPAKPYFGRAETPSWYKTFKKVGASSARSLAGPELTATLMP